MISVSFVLLFKWILNTFMLSANSSECCFLLPGPCSSRTVVKETAIWRPCDPEPWEQFIPIRDPVLVFRVHLFGIGWW